MTRKVQIIETGEMVKTELKYSMNILNANPFLNKLVVPARRLEAKDSEHQGVLIETTQFTKIFHNTSLTDNHIVGLPARALALFVYIQYNMKEGEHWVVINRRKHFSQTNMSDVTYTSAIEDLIIGDVIATSLYKNVFYVNPQIIFSGNRIKNFRNKVIEE